MIFAECLPKIKLFTRSLAPFAPTLLLIRCIAGFLNHRGSHSASQAADAIRTDSCHRATISRGLARLGVSGWALLTAASQRLLRTDSRGTWLLLLDQTYVSQAGDQTPNTFSTRNTTPRVRKSARRQKKGAKKSCHAWVMGLIITPDGRRIPLAQAYYTPAYANARGIPHRTQTEIAAELILTSPIPQSAKVLVIGDTSYDAQSIRKACHLRNYSWIVPVNAERVLAGAKGQRPKVRSLCSTFCASQFSAIELHPGRASGRHHRRLSRHRVGPKVKSRTYYVQRECHRVHSVGAVVLVFSTKE
jgi:hypothetical protein